MYLADHAHATADGHAVGGPGIGHGERRSRRGQRRAARGWCGPRVRAMQRPARLRLCRRRDSCVRSAGAATCRSRRLSAAAGCGVARRVCWHGSSARAATRASPRAGSIGTQSIAAAHAAGLARGQAGGPRRPSVRRGIAAPEAEPAVAMRRALL